MTGRAVVSDRTWTIAGILFVIAGVGSALGGRLLLDGVVGSVFRYGLLAAPAIAVILLAWGGSNRHSFLTNRSVGWVAAIAFSVFPLVPKVMSEIELAMTGSTMSAPGFDASRAAIPLMCAAMAIVAGGVLVTQAARSGVLAEGFTWVPFVCWVVVSALVFVGFFVGATYVFASGIVIVSNLLAIATSMSLVMLGVVAFVTARDLGYQNQAAASLVARNSEEIAI